MSMNPEARAVLDRLYADDARQREQGLTSAQRTRNLNAETGAFVNLLAQAVGARRILEIGSSNGVSAIWWAAALAETGGQLIGTELMPERAAAANDNLAAAGLAGFGQIVSGPAGATIKTLSPGFDIVFIDAEKDDYLGHFGAAFPLLRAGGLVIADNVISHDLTNYQKMLRSRPDVQTSTVPIGQGIEISLKLG